MAGIATLSDQEELAAALTPVVRAFNDLNVRYCVGGSVASSFHGAARSTMDVDLFCELTADIVPAFLSRFDEDFHVNESAVRSAVERKACCHLIHLPTSFKVDVFISRQREFDLSRMSRAMEEELPGKKSVAVRMTSAEDSVISKLEWYREGNETSERQWDDVSRLLLLMGDEADIAYLKQAAESVGVADLLQRLISR